jgi:hypothetical protein
MFDRTKVKQTKRQKCKSKTILKDIFMRYILQATFLFCFSTTSLALANVNVDKKNDKYTVEPGGHVR